MQCTNHGQAEACGICIYCGKFFCNECLVEIEGRFYCKEHVMQLVSDIRKQSEYKEKNISSGVVINNSLNNRSDSKSSVKVKKNTAINGYGVHFILQLFSMLGALGFGYLGLVSLFQYDKRMLLFCFFMFCVTIIFWLSDYRYCDRGTNYSKIDIK